MVNLFLRTQHLPLQYFKQLNGTTRFVSNIKNNTFELGTNYTISGHFRKQTRTSSKEMNTYLNISNTQLIHLGDKINDFLQYLVK